MNRNIDMDRISIYSVVNLLCKLNDYRVGEYFE